MKKLNTISIFIIVSIFLLIIYFNEIFIVQGEPFESNNIDMYVISLRNSERLENIKTQENKIGKSVNIFDAVKGDELNSSELCKEGILDKIYENASGKDLRVIGCYLSHLNLLKKIDNNTGYTIIFEDDFVIDSSVFMEDVNTIIKKAPHFDLLLLGNSSKNKGENIIDNIYKIDNDTPLWGTYGYVVNNKQTSKIINAIQKIDMAIDNKYETLGKLNTLNIFVIDPIIVNHKHDVPSTINLEGFSSHLFSNKYYVF